MVVNIYKRNISVEIRSKEENEDNCTSGGESSHKRGELIKNENMNTLILEEGIDKE